MNKHRKVFHVAALALFGIMLGWPGDQAIAQTGGVVDPSGDWLQGPVTQRDFDVNKATTVTLKKEGANIVYLNSGLRAIYEPVFNQPGTYVFKRVLNAQGMTTFEATTGVALISVNNANSVTWNLNGNVYFLKRKKVEVDPSGQWAQGPAGVKEYDVKSGKRIEIRKEGKNLVYVNQGLRAIYEP